LTWTDEDRAAEARLRRRYRAASEPESLNRFTTAAAVMAIGLSIALFFQTAISQISPGDVGGAIVSLITSVLPGAGGIQGPSRNPQPSPVRPVVTTGSS